VFGWIGDRERDMKVVLAVVDARWQVDRHSRVPRRGRVDERLQLKNHVRVICDDAVVLDVVVPGRGGFTGLYSSASKLKTWTSPRPGAVVAIALP